MSINFHHVGSGNSAGRVCSMQPALELVLDVWHFVFSLSFIHFILSQPGFCITEHHDP